MAKKKRSALPSGREPEHRFTRSECERRRKLRRKHPEPSGYDPTAYYPVIEQELLTVKALDY